MTIELDILPTKAMKPAARLITHWREQLRPANDEMLGSSVQVIDRSTQVAIPENHRFLKLESYYRFEISKTNTETGHYFCERDFVEDFGQNLNDEVREKLIKAWKVRGQHFTLESTAGRGPNKGVSSPR